MKFRIARHTKDLKPLIEFYSNILGLEILGQFNDHDNYNGVFIGEKSSDWHLEFTTSDDTLIHNPGEDDLLVFYPTSVDEYNAIKQRFAANNVKEEVAKNPYWRKNGIVFNDPDGFKIVIAKL